MTTRLEDLLPFDTLTGDIIVRRVPVPQDARADPPRGRVVTNVPRTVIHHSPSGYEFGFGGSGPADLALNVLNLFVPPGADGLPPVRCYRHTASRTAWQLHQPFKWKFIGPLPEGGGVLPGTLIRAWIAEQQPAILELYAHELSGHVEEHLEEKEQPEETGALEQRN